MLILVSFKLDCSLTLILCEGHSKNIKCNPNGGGTGWSAADVNSRSGSYGSGAPKSYFKDIPIEALEDVSLLDQVPQLQTGKLV